MNRLKSLFWAILVIVIFLAWSDGRDSAIGFARGTGHVLAIAWDAVIEFAKTFGDETQKTPDN